MSQAEIRDEPLLEVSEPVSLPPLKGFVVVTIPVGNMSPKDVPEYISLISRTMLEKDQLKARTNAAGYTFLFAPSRPDSSGRHVGPTIELLRFDDDKEAVVNLADILRGLPEELKCRVS